MKIYFVRHAEPDYELSKKDRGEYPGAELSKKGLEQAEKLASALSKIQFDRIYCSNLKRTEQTIEPLKKIKSQNIIFDSRIRETADVINGYLNHNDFDEPEIDQKKRLESFMKDIKQRFGSILIVSHFNTIEYLSRELGRHIKKPEYAHINIIEI